MPLMAHQTQNCVFVGDTLYSRTRSPLLWPSGSLSSPRKPRVKRLLVGDLPGGLLGREMFPGVSYKPLPMDKLKGRDSQDLRSCVVRGSRMSRVWPMSLTPMKRIMPQLPFASILLAFISAFVYLLLPETKVYKSSYFRVKLKRNKFGL